MAGDTIITVVGNLTHDPELRFTPSGAAVASFTIASTPRTYDRQSGEWKDGDALFMRCSLWRDAAENVAESLTKGMRVIAQGRLVQRSYTTREGEQRTVVEMQVDEIGPSLRYAKAQVTRNSRGGGNYGGNNAGASNGGGYGGSQGGYNANNNASAGGYSGYNSAPQGGSAGDPWATGAVPIARCLARDLLSAECLMQGLPNAGGLSHQRPPIWDHLGRAPRHSSLEC